MKIYGSLKSILFTFLCLIISVFPVLAQFPDGVDAGQSDDAVSIYQQPKYIIPVVVFIVILIIFYFWQKRSTKK